MAGDSAAESRWRLVKKIDFVAIPPDAAHWQAMLDLVSRVFSGSGYWEFLNGCRQWYIEGSHYDVGASRIGILDRRVVTHWGVWDYRMRIGRCAVRVGGIGAVSTHGECRQRGLMFRTGQDSIQAMRRLGYDFTILFGIRGFYHRFGYVRAWPEQGFNMNTPDVEISTRGQAPTMRRFGLMDREGVDRLYNRYHAGLTGTAIRPTYTTPKADFGGAKYHGWLWPSGRRPGGFVVVCPRENALNLIDEAGEPEDVLAALGKLAAKHRCREIRMGLHADSALARLLRRLSCRVEMHYFRDGGPMIRTINLPSALRKIAPELSRRLKSSTLAAWRGALLVADSRERAMLKIDRGRLAVGPPAKTAHAVRGGDEVARLLIGSAEPEEVVEAGRMRLSGDAAKLVRVLFPAQRPMLQSWDRF